MSKRKTKTRKLPEKVVVIKNTEKDVGNWMESWSKPKNRSVGHIPHPFRLLALGGVGRGKTNMLKNIFLKHQGSKKKFKKLFIITCDISSQEWLDCCPDLVSDQIPSLDEFDDGVKTCVCIDDYEFEKASPLEQKKLSTLMRFISSHRNVSVLLSFQSFFSVPSIARKTANCFMIYNSPSRQELTTIDNRVGLEAGTLRSLFKTICSDTYDCVFIDRTIGTPYPLRKNIYEVIDYDSDSD